MTPAAQEGYIGWSEREPEDPEVLSFREAAVVFIDIMVKNNAIRLINQESAIVMMAMALQKMVDTTLSEIKRLRSEA